MSNLNREQLPTRDSLRSVVHGMPGYAETPVSELIVDEISARMNRRFDEATSMIVDLYLFAVMNAVSMEGNRSNDELIALIHQNYAYLKLIAIVDLADSTTEDLIIEMKDKLAAASTSTHYS